VNERDRPLCDVFWNNEIIHTIRLWQLGMLEPYASPATEPYPLKATDHTWGAFAERARVLIVNTSLVPEAQRPKSLLKLTDPRWNGKVVMAKPQYGTTATHVACLFEVLGPEKARQYYLDLAGNEVQIAPGNKQVAEWVGRGKTPACQEVIVGVTDTGDALGEMEKNPNIDMIFPDRHGLGTLFIPNTLCGIKGGPNPAGAWKLIDFLLSP
jgi:iron(III) transport system substrate-binding protein